MIRVIDMTDGLHGLVCSIDGVPRMIVDDLPRIGTHI